jgi:hypothetical protein
VKDWPKTLKDYSGSGIYSISRDGDLIEIEREAASNSLAFFKVDLSGASTKEDFLRNISEALEFPSYFGMNWDAFEECINDMEWHPAPGYAIVLNAAGAFSRKSPEDFKMAKTILKSAVKRWKMQKKPFFIFLADK